MNDEYLDGKLSLLIIALIIILIVFYISYRKENKKAKETFFVQKNQSKLSKKAGLYFKAIKYSLIIFLTIPFIAGLVLLAVNIYLGLSVFVLLVLLQLFAHKNYVKSLIYKGLTIEEQKIIINKYPPNADQIILFDGVHKITFEDIYQKDRKGFDQKIGCEMIFWNKDDIMIDSFDVEKFKKSEQLKAAIFDRISIS